MNIVSCFSNQYVQHFMVMAKSLLVNTEHREVNFHIIYRNLEVDTLSLIINEFKEYKETRFYFYKQDFKKVDFLPLELDYLAHETYCRLILTDVLPTNLEKIIYIDTDTVIRNDIQELFTLDLENYLLGASLDMNSRVADHLEEVDTALNYFNAGVLLINLKKWREEKISEQLLEYARRNYKKLKYADQDVLNSVLQGRWYKIDSKWNVVRNIFDGSLEELGEFTTELEINSIRDNPWIIHYTTGSKPWHYFDNHPYKKEYLYYKNQLNTKFDEYPEYGFLKERNIIIFGTGEKGKQDFHFLKNCNIDVQFFLDNDKNKWGQLCCNKLILAPTLEKITSIEKPLILISSQYFMEIGYQLTNLELVENKNYFLNLHEMINYLPN